MVSVLILDSQNMVNTRFTSSGDIGVVMVHYAGDFGVVVVVETFFCKASICDCCKSAIIKCIHCPGGICIDGVGVAVVVMVVYWL